MLKSLYKRLFILGIVAGCAGYAIMLALAPWMLIIWFIWFRK